MTKLPHVHGLVAGLCLRLLLNTASLAPEDAAREIQVTLPLGVPPSQEAYWLQGFLSDSGLLLLHQEALWGLIDEWISSMSAERFTAVLPLLARTFSTFPAAERRQLGESIRPGHKKAHSITDERGFDREAADASLPLLAKLFGSQTVKSEENT